MYGPIMSRTSLLAARTLQQFRLGEGDYLCLLEILYINLSDLADDYEEINIITKLQYLHYGRNAECRGCTCGCPEMLARISSGNAHDCLIMLELCFIIKTLGLHWKLSSGSYSCKAAPPMISFHHSEIDLVYVSKTCNSLVCFTHAILIDKFFTEEFWNLELDWDKALPSHGLSFEHGEFGMLHIRFHIQMYCCIASVLLSWTSVLQLHRLCHTMGRANRIGFDLEMIYSKIHIKMSSKAS